MVSNLLLPQCGALGARLRKLLNISLALVITVFIGISFLWLEGIIRSQRQQSFDIFKELVISKLERPLSLGEFIQAQDILSRMTWPKELIQVEVVYREKPDHIVVQYGVETSCQKLNRKSFSLVNPSSHAIWGKTPSNMVFMLESEECTVQKAQVKLGAIIGLLGLLALGVMTVVSPLLVRLGLRPLEESVNRANERELLESDGYIEASPREIQPLLKALKVGYQRANHARLLEEREKIVRQVAHDIRSPLSFLKIFTKTATGLDPKQVDTLGLVVQRIEDVASDLSGNPVRRGVQNELERIPVDRAIREIIAEKEFCLKSASYGDKSVQVFLNKVSAEDLLAYGIQRDLKRLIANVIQNSIEAIEKQGRIDISLSHEGEFLVIAVADNGKGFPSELREKIGTEPISYGKAGLSGSGQGLGLYSAHQTLKTWGGFMQISESPGQGALVKLYLPKSPGLKQVVP